MSNDPLVRLWRDTTRPLNWQPWRWLTAAEQARLRYLLIDELHYFDTSAASPYCWRHAHRQLLELKAACGHGGIARETSPYRG